MRRYALLLAAILALASALPAAAQVTAPPNNGPRGNPGGLTLNPNGIFGAIVNQAIRQAAQQAVDQAGQTTTTTQNPPATQTRTTKPPTKKTAPKPTQPVFRDVPLPFPRPDTFLGRPIDLDLPHAPDRLIVVLDPGLAEPMQFAEALAEKTRFELDLIEVRTLGLGGIVVASYRLPEGVDPGEVVAALKPLKGVVAVQPDYLYRATAAPADMTGLQYAPQRLNALVAREAGDGTGVTIGLIDTGIDTSQPALGGADIETFDVLSDRPVADRDHGTALAGLMLARQGFEGIAPGARLVAVRAFDTGADGAVLSTSFEIASAIDLAVAKGARVLNLSFAGPRDPLVLSVLDAAAGEGVILVAAAGNGGPEAGPAYPGAHRLAIAVTATDSHDALYSGANRGGYVAIAAPGVDVLSPLPDARFELMTGTSIATAHVSAIVALMLAQHPGLDRGGALVILAASAHDLGAAGADADFGAGLADAAAAVAASE